MCSSLLTKAWVAKGKNVQRKNEIHIYVIACPFGGGYEAEKNMTCTHIHKSDKLIMAI